MQHFSHLWVTSFDPAQTGKLPHKADTRTTRTLPLKITPAIGQRRNSVAKHSNGNSKKKPPYPTDSDKAAATDRIDSFVYCSLIRAVPFSATVLIDRLVATRFGFLCRVALTHHSQLRAPPVWYSITRVSKKFRSFFRSIISLIHGNGFSSCANKASRPICCARRLAMNRR